MGQITSRRLAHTTCVVMLPRQPADAVKVQLTATSASLLQRSEWLPLLLLLLLGFAGAEAVAKEVAVLRSAAQSEMFLDEESSPAAVTDELHHLIIQLKSQQDDLARINKYQRLFKVWMCVRCACLLGVHVC